MKEDNPDRIILRFCETASHDSHGKLEHSEFSRKFAIGASAQAERSLCVVLIAKNTENVRLDRGMTLHIAGPGVELPPIPVELFPRGIGEHAAQFEALKGAFQTGRYTAELKRGETLVQSDHWNFVAE